MHVDESFVRFVALRWSMLYRLAALLVGEDAAESVTQATLVRAYASWQEVLHAGSPDDHLKELLARTAAAVGARRDRIVTTLRHYEDFSDADIARALRCSPKMVAARAALPDDGDSAGLRDALVRQAGDVVVPLPDVEDLLAQARRSARQQRRRRVGQAAAAAITLVAALALTNLVRDSRTHESDHPLHDPLRALPASLDALPGGASAQVAYADGSTLRLDGGRAVSLPGSPQVLATTRSGVYLTLPSGRILRVEAPAGTTETVATSSDGQLVSDPSGAHVAWVEAGPGRPSVVVGDVGSSGGALLTRARPFPAASWCCDNPFVLDGMTGSGQLVASLPAEGLAWVWDTRHQVEPTADAPRIAGLGNGVVSQVTAGEVVIENGSHFAAGTLREDGSFLVDYEIDARQVDFADPTGERVLFVDRVGETRILERTTRGRQRNPENVRLQLPRLETGYTAVRWEDAGHVLLDVADESIPKGALVRCDVADGDCQVVARFGGPHVLTR